MLRKRMVIVLIVALAASTAPSAHAGAAALPIEPAFPQSPVFVSAADVRLFDSRAGAGDRGAAGAGTNIRLPAPTRSAPVVNLTVDDAEIDGYLTAFQCDKAMPPTSNLNYRAGRHPIANLAIPMAGTFTNGGESTIDSICVYTSAATTLIVDLVGYLPIDHMYTSGGLRNPGYRPMGPHRVLDTRQPSSPVTRLDAGSMTPLTMLQPVSWSIPDAVAVNVTAVNPSTPGYLSIVDCAASTVQPATSMLNFGTSTVANLTVVDAGTAQCLYTSADVDVLVDVFGYLMRGSPNPFQPADPPAEVPWPHGERRLLDTRSGNRPAAGDVVSAAWRPAAPDSGAIATTITIVNADTTGYATAFPCGGPVPPTSTVNFEPGQARAATAIVVRGSEAKVCVYTSASADVIIDETAQFGGGCIDAACLNPLTALMLSCSGHFASAAAPVSVDASQLRVYPDGGVGPYQVTVSGIDGWTASISGNQIVLVPDDPPSGAQTIPAHLRLTDSAGASVDQDLLISVPGSAAC